jgi:hypothetical protein
LSGSDQHSRKKQKIMDFTVYRDTDVIWKNQNNKIEKYMHVDVGTVDLRLD